MNEAKIAPNLINIGFHAYPSIGYLNPISNSILIKLRNAHIFNLSLTNLQRGEKTTPNFINIGVHAYLSNGYLNPLSKLNSKKVDKGESFNP